MTDVRELDFRAYIEQRRAAVDAKLAIARHYREHARRRYEAHQNPATRHLLALAMATCFIGEAEREALDVEFP